MPKKNAAKKIIDKMGRKTEIKNITDQTVCIKEVQNEHSENSQMYQMLVETMNDGLIIRDKKGNISFANKTFCQMLGYSNTSEIIGQPVENFLDENNKEILKKQLEKRLAGKSMPYEIAFRHKSGNLIYTVVSPRIIFDESGNFKSSFAVITDINPYKETLQQLHESKTFLENIFQTSLDVIIITDSKGDIVMVNRAVEKMFGYTAAEMIGRHVSDFFPSDEYSSFLGSKMMEVLFKRNSVEGVNAEFKNSNAKVLNIEMSINLIRDETDTVSGAVAIIRDITEKKEIEKQLLQNEKLKSIAALSAGVAHDFNNVLAAILGRSQLLKRFLERPDFTKYLNRTKNGLELIEKTAIQGAETVRRIQEFAKTDEGGSENEQIDLEKIISDSLDFTIAARKNDLETKAISYNISKDIPPLPKISGSSSELREVFINIFTNSFDEMPGGGTITVKGFADENQITIKIRDSGKGVREEIRERIFDPFFTTKGPQSSGLGLSVSYGIIKRYGGTISADSPEGGGVEFSIFLPIKEKTPEKAAPVIDYIKGVKNLSVLIVEDEESVRNLLFDIVSDEYHNTSVASDGIEGLKLFKENKFDLVITDLGMPGMSGIELTAKIKKIDSSTPVIMVTGWDVNDREKEIRKSGVDIIIKKPFHMEQIIDALNRLQRGN